MADNRRMPRGGHGPGNQAHGFQRPKDMKGTFKKLMHYVGRYKAALVLVAVCLIASSAGSVATSYMLKPLLNDYILPGDFPGLFRMLLLMGGLFALSALCSFAYSRIMVHVAQRTVAAIRQDLFTNDIDTVSEMLNSSFASIISNVLTFVGTVLMMIILNPILTLITFAFLALMGGVVKVVGGLSRVNFQRQQKALGAVNGYIEEMIEGQKVIKVFNHEKKAVSRFTALNDEYRQAATAAQAYAGMMMPAMGNLSKINYAVTCCVGGLLAMAGMFDVGSLGAYLLYVKQVSQPVGQISQQVNTLLAAAAGAERIFAVMDARPEIDEGKTVIVRVEKDGDGLTETARRTGRWAWKKPDGTLVELRGDVRFDHVTFSYAGTGAPSLSDITFSAKKGSTIGIIGGTGSGKSTLVDLIARFYDASSGTVTLDGQNVQTYSQKELREKIGVVPQKAALFQGTIRENLSWGREDATDEEMWEALTTAQASEIVEKKQGQLDFRLEQNGRNLSGGQRQRLTIARALVKKPEILILDDSASALDFATDAALRKSLHQLGGNTTTFLVSQRAASIRQADLILVLDDGQLAGKGTHQELISTCKTYREIFFSQFPEERAKYEKATGKEVLA